jgi:putative oxidoreductase
VNFLGTVCDAGEKMADMPLVRPFGRAALGATFVSLGWDPFLEPGGRTVKAAALGIPRPELAVRLNGAGMVVAGVALTAGVAPRLSAAVLAALLVPTTVAGHAYWNESDPKVRAQQRIHFAKNLAMLGGLLEVAAGGSRRPAKEDR